MKEPANTANPQAQPLWTLLVHVRRLDALSPDDPQWTEQRRHVAAALSSVVDARHHDPEFRADREFEAVAILFPDDTQNAHPTASSYDRGFSDDDVELIAECIRNGSTPC